MKTETNNSSKLLSRVIKIGIFGGLLFLVIYYALLFIFGVKYLNPDYYGSYFYAWRLNYADKMMTHGRYKLIKKNEHPDTPEREAFYKIAQEGKAYLTRFDRPEHYPREFGFHFSLLFPAYESFLEMRQNYIVKTEDLEKKLDLKGEELTKEIKSRKENEFFYFANAPGKSINDIFKILFPKDNENPWFDVSKILVKIVSRILGDEKDYLFDGEKVSGELMADIKKGISALKMDKEISDEEINRFFVKNGRVSASPIETFAYSRLYYIFYFLTSGIKLEASHLTELEGSMGNSSKKKQEFYEARMMYVANIFARIVSSLYPNKNNKDVSNVGVWEWFRNYYSPSRTVDPDPIKDSDIDLVKEEFKSATV